MKARLVNSDHSKTRDTYVSSPAPQTIMKSQYVFSRIGDDDIYGSDPTNLHFKLSHVESIDVTPEWKKRLPGYEQDFDRTAVYVEVTAQEADMARAAGVAAERVRQIAEAAAAAAARAQQQQVYEALRQQAQAAAVAIAQPAQTPQQSSVQPSVLWGYQGGTYGTPAQLAARQGQATVAVEKAKESALPAPVVPKPRMMKRS